MARRPSHRACFRCRGNRRQDRAQSNATVQPFPLASSRTTSFLFQQAYSSFFLYHFPRDRGTKHRVFKVNTQPKVSNNRSVRGIRPSTLASSVLLPSFHSSTTNERAWPGGSGV